MPVLRHKHCIYTVQAVSAELSQEEQRRNEGKRMKRRCRTWIAFLLLFAMVLQSGFQNVVYASAQDAQTASSKVTLSTTLQDNMVLKSSKKTFDVYARDENNAKITSEVTLDGEEVAQNWNDSEKTSYTLDFSEKESGKYIVVVSAGSGEAERTLTYTIQYQKAAEGEFIGYAVMDIEAFTVSLGYLAEPVLVPLYEGENAAGVLTRLITENGYGYDCTGSIASGFYLSGIYGSNYSKGSDAEKELDLSSASLEPGIAEKLPDIESSFRAEDYEEGWLGEFDFNYMSGWMYTVNNEFPNVGCSDTWLSDGDVIRVQYTLGYGQDIGGAGALGGTGEDAFATADKDALLTLLAKVNSAANAAVIKEDAVIKPLLEEADQVMADITADQSAVDDIRERLQRALYGETITDITLDCESTTMPVGDTLQLSAKVSPEDTKYPVNIDWSSSDNTVVTVENGLVTAVGTGKAVVSASLGNYSVNCTVTVREWEYSFRVTPADAVVYLYDAQSDRVQPSEGKYIVSAGEQYSYTVCKKGYQAQQQTFTAGELEEVITVNLEKADEVTYQNYTAEWPSFRNDSNNMGITSAQTPIEKNHTQLLWGTKVGTGYGANAAGTPILVDGSIYCMQGTNLLKYDKKTGMPVTDDHGNQIKGNMVAGNQYNIVPPTYADGMIFVPLNGGRIQAFNAETLESLWVYTDPLGGQANSPIACSDGYIYTGFWNSETKAASFVCLSVTDEDTDTEDESKAAIWRDKINGGVYWAGAYVNEKYCIVGTDDGASGHTQPTAHLKVYDKVSGEIVDDISGFTGDIRSSIVYDKESERIYFTSKGGYLYSLALHEDGTPNQESMTSFALGGMSTSTPVIAGGRLYIGVSGSSQFGTSGHNLQVVAIQENGQMELAYNAALPGYPQASGTVTTAYVESSGYIYVYFTCNSNPGSLYCLKDKPGQSDGTVEEIFQPTGSMASYCVCSVVADNEGTLYYKNDSGYLMAVTRNDAYLAGVTVNGGNAVVDGGGFDPQQAEHEIVADRGTEEISLIVSLPDGAQASLNGQSADRFTIELDGESKTVTVIVTAGSQMREYTFTIRERSNDASLSSLRVNTSNSYSSSLVELSPAFESGVYTYSAKYDATKTFLNLWPDTNDAQASVSVFPVRGVDSSRTLNTDGSIPVTATNNGHARYAVYFAEGYDTARVKVVVTAEDGVSRKEYTVELARKDTNAPVLTLGENPILSRDSSSVTLGFSSSEAAAGYVEIVAGTETVTGASITVREDYNTVRLEDIPATSCAVYLTAEDDAGYRSETYYIAIPAYQEPVMSPTVSPQESMIPATDAPTGTPQESTAPTTIPTVSPGQESMTPATATPTGTPQESTIPTTATPTGAPQESTTPATETPTTAAPGEEPAPVPAVTQGPVKVALPSKQNIYTNQKYKLTVQTENTAAGLKWSSSNPKVVKVTKNGVITGLKPGKAVITVRTSDGNSTVASCTVTVSNISLKINSKKSLQKKTSLTMQKMISGDKITSWKVLKKKIIAISKKGKITPVRLGKTVLRLKTRYGGRVSLKITVTAKQNGKLILSWKKKK